VADKPTDEEILAVIAAKELEDALDVDAAQPPADAGDE